MLDGIEKQFIITVPIAEKTPAGWEFSWCSGQEEIVKVSAANIHANGKGIEALITVWPDYMQDPLVVNQLVNINSYRSKKEIVDAIKAQCIPSQVNWASLLEQCYYQLTVRINSPLIVSDLNTEPISMGVNYVLHPLLPFGHPTTLYCPGGSGKSITSDFLGFIIQNGIAVPSLNFYPLKQNVLYLDWEADEETHKRYIKAIKAGLGIDAAEKFSYIKLERPLHSEVANIIEVVKTNEIGFIIIDSQMAATAEGDKYMSESQVASQYYNDIRSFNCSTLTLDHVTKEAMKFDDNSGTAYGSVVKYNRVRCQWEMKKTQEEDGSYIELALSNKKFNLGRLHKPIGIRINFENDSDVLVNVTFEPCDLAENPVLSKTLPVKTRLINSLRKIKRADVTTLAEYIDAKESTVRTELSRSKNYFVELSNKEWGLKNKFDI